MLTTTALRLLDTQKPGIIFLSQVTFLNVTLDCHMRACMLEMVNIVNFYCQRSYGMMHDFNMHSCMMKMVMVNIISPISGFSGVDCCSSLLLIILCIPSQRQTCEAFSEEDQLWSIVFVRNFDHLFFYLQVFVSTYSVACFSSNLDILVVSRCCGTWYILDACLCVRVPVLELILAYSVWKSYFLVSYVVIIIFWNPRICFLCFQDSVWRLQSKTGK